jgi:hypothetical protein
MSLEVDVVSLVGDPATALIAEALQIEHQADGVLAGLDGRNTRLTRPCRGCGQEC